jgi:hypothetical protein
MRDVPIDVRWDPKLAVPERDWDHVFRVVPLDTMSYDDLHAHLRNSVVTTHGHVHTATCKKGGRRGDHYDCRMDYDLPLIPETCRLADENFALRREDGMLTPLIAGLQLAYPANHVMQLTCDATRWVRHRLLHNDAQKLTEKQVRNRSVRIQD